MSIKFTTGWARKQIKSTQEWQAWINTIKDGDRVVVQQFVPMGDYGNCFHSQAECWRFWDAEIRFGSGRDSGRFNVWYANDTHPYKHGRAVYWNSDKYHGDVFGTRIVPFHGDLVKEGRRFIDCHAPVWEDNWRYRCLFLVEHQKGFPEICDRVSDIENLYFYSRDIDEGSLFIAFGDRDKIRLQIESVPEARFLYSEFVGR